MRFRVVQLRVQCVFFSLEHLLVEVVPLWLIVLDLGFVVRVGRIHGDVRTQPAGQGTHSTRHAQRLRASSNFGSHRLACSHNLK